ncbi:S41 family peptidase [Sphingobacterium sp. UDSM-2020]|uniref:S41 family peptidase n=1 Tax=Sphingobacterium sp. UDSM-2020 TaxID=2795738 RepID=UPI001934B78C|nr:S41 family peptidase [Sphingobacterium sp. UDSM-2020]QQD15206.1 PD40 domain-containing protein [Sphingobacterium sp. UDSM-2020]
MIRKLLLGTCLALGGTMHAFAQQQPTFLSHPTLSPDGKVLVFSFEGDLWKVESEGGVAVRLTGMEGNEINPRISPDGKQLAFSANQNGNMDVYIMPLAGGDIRQITHHDGADEVDSWSWDSKTLYFTSTRYNRMSSYQVDATGGTAKRLFPHYFNYISQVVTTPSGELLFNDSWEGYSSTNRKRYKGAFNPDIKSYNPKTKTFKQYTDYNGKDFWPTVDQNGVIYFVSDQGNAEYNLYQMSGDKPVALTSFKESIKRPAVAANGKKIVFEKGYQLFLYDVASKKVTQPTIALSRNQVLGKSKEFNVNGNISYFDVALDGKKMAFVSRGELFVSDSEGKFIRQMPSQGQRVMEVKWLKDNKTLLYSQTHQGYLNWYTRSADGLGEPKQLTQDLRNNRELTFNADKSHAVYLSGRDEVRLLDLTTLNSKTVVKDELWAFQNSSPSFSPDGKYILFTAIRNFEQDIFVHHIGSGQTTNLTNTGVTEASPSWSPDGKYIYFASNRTKPSFPTGMQNSSIFRMALENFDEPYRISKFNELFSQPAKKDTITDNKNDNKTKAKDKKEEKATSSSTDKKVLVTIDVKGLRDRIEQVSPAFGTQSDPIAILKGEKNYVFFSSNHEGKYGLYRTIYEPFEAVKTEKVVDNGINQFIESGGKYFILNRGVIQKYNLDQNKLDAVTINFRFNRDLENEFKQMFYETWAGLEENYYDSTFHGIDWTAMKKKYEPYLSGINDRSDLRILLNDMLGELNSSHLGFSSMGAEERKPFGDVTNEIGVLFNQDNPYQIAQIIDNSPASRKGVDLKEGDEIMAVNGNKVNPKEDRDQYFTWPSLAEEIQLTILRGGKEISVFIRPLTSTAFKDLIYDEWMKGNRGKVDQWSNGKIAYSHMKNMGGPELQRFLIDMAEQENNKDGIILDLRYNTGGNVHDEVLRFLSQRPYLKWQYRGGQRAPQSNFAPASKPIVLLINEQSLSDAEMTAAGFKELKLGKIIGNETYRWIIFTSAKGLVDGSSYRVPAWGCYTLAGQDLELSGVAPDIVVKNTIADRTNDKDPQLERAVQEILKDLK